MSYNFPYIPPLSHRTVVYTLSVVPQNNEQFPPSFAQSGLAPFVFTPLPRVTDRRRAKLAEMEGRPVPVQGWAGKGRDGKGKASGGGRQVCTSGSSAVAAEDMYR